jgi:hypothetical protein
MKIDIQRMLREVHMRDQVTGQVAQEKPYRMQVRNRVRIYEYPKGSNEYYDESGESIQLPEDRKFTPVKTKMSQAMELQKLREMAAKLEAENEALKSGKEVSEDAAKELLAQKQELEAAVPEVVEEKSSVDPSVKRVTRTYKGAGEHGKKS